MTIESFEARQKGANVVITWRSASEAEIIGYNVLRAAGAGDLTPVNAELIPAARAGQDSGSDYLFRDDGLAPGVYVYA